MKIYKITKPTDVETVYIGKTKESLNVRFSKHKSQSKTKKHRLIYQWLDNTCEIELIENYNGNDSNIREMEIIQDYINNGYKLVNEKIGKMLLGGYNYVKTRNKINAKKYNNKKSNEYGKWISKIYRAAKKEGLSSIEYKLKYSIPDYDGPKFKY